MRKLLLLVLCCILIASCGRKVVLDTYENTEEMMSKMASAGEQYDVLVVSDHAIPVMAAKGAFRPLDKKKVPNAKNVDSRFVTPAYDPQGKYSLPYQWGTMGIVFRKDKLPGFIPSWSALLDPARAAGPGRSSGLDARPDGGGPLLTGVLPEHPESR